jgi:putative cell wall-binding protein
LPDPVANELRRLSPTTVVLVGGDGVLDDATEARVKAAVGTASVQIVRVAGPDRFTTSVRLAERFGTASVVYVATGRDFPDALSAAAVAGSKGAPVILVAGESSTLTDAQIALLRALSATQAVIVGGDAVVSPGIEAHLAQLGVSVSRVGGANRYETNGLLNLASFTGPLQRVYAATGADFPDALTGSALAGVHAAPLLLSRTACAEGTLADMLHSGPAAALTLLGGPGALSAEVARLARC